MKNHENILKHKQHIQKYPIKIPDQMVSFRIGFLIHWKLNFKNCQVT